MNKTIIANALLGALVAAPAYAHHSFAMFDHSEKVLHGTVKDFQWTNPHIWVQLDTTDADGKSVEWSLEGNSPSVLSRHNWTKHTLKPGDVVTVTINPLKDGRNGGDLIKIIMADGTQIDNDQKPVPEASGK